MEEIFNSPSSGTGLLVQNGGTPVASSAISVEVELLNEQTLERSRLRVIVSKGVTDGFFIFRFKQLFPDVLSGVIYSYCVSSGGDTIDTFSGRFKVVEDVSMRTLSEQIETFKRQNEQTLRMKSFSDSGFGFQRVREINSQGVNNA